MVAASRRSRCSRGRELERFGQNMTEIRRSGYLRPARRRGTRKPSPSRGGGPSTGGPLPGADAVPMLLRLVTPIIRILLRPERFRRRRRHQRRLLLEHDEGLVVTCSGQLVISPSPTALPRAGLSSAQLTSSRSVVAAATALGDGTPSFCQHAAARRVHIDGCIVECFIPPGRSSITR